MGLFNKKTDPISEREKVLSAEIAALAEKIKKLNAQPPPAPSHPRMRSTALPHGATVPATPPLPPPPPAPPEPIFEDVGQNKLQAKEPFSPLDQAAQLGMKKYDWPGFFRRLRDNFRGRSTANPKLVNYLAAGSIQGLRPLRYEKRVARNRFIAFACALLLVLLGVIAMFKRHH